jgi:hypothetical protein
VVSAVFGLGGIGKSTLAAAVTQSRRVPERFADGVLWVTLGQKPEVQALLGQWIRDLGDHEFRAVDESAALGRLRQLLQDRAVLLVVDDGWDSEHVKPFRVGGPRCRLLVTTRKPRIADELHAISHELDVLSSEQSVQLLVSRLQRPLRQDEKAPARRLAEAVGYLPLALELAAVRITHQVLWDELLQKLDREVAALEALNNPAERWMKKRTVQLEASLLLSLRALHWENEEAWRCFVWLGVLLDDTTLAAPMASALWGFSDEDEADGLLEFLWGEALLQATASVRVGEREWRAYRVHDLLHDCARRLLAAPAQPRREADLPGLGLTRAEAHWQLLERYHSRTRNGLWHTLPPDGYIHGRLVWHLEQAGDVEGLHALLREETDETDERQGWPRGRNGWYEANERLGQLANFADCVALAWRLSDEAFRTEGAKGTLGLQCRYALVSTSLNSLAGNLRPPLLRALVENRVWPVEQALACARRAPEPAQKVEALAALVPLLSPTARSGVLGEALAAARSIGDEECGSGALAALAPVLSRELLGEALDAARSIGDECCRSGALAALALVLPQQERATVLTEALTAARSTGAERLRSRALAALAPVLSEQERATALTEALAAARSIEAESSRAAALAALTPVLPRELLAEALTAARSLGPEWYRSRALAELAPVLPGELLAEALTAARSLESEWYRSPVLTALAPGLCGLSFAELSRLWLQTIPVLAARARRDLLADLKSLAPVLVALAGPDAPTELCEVACAVFDVARWWP